MLQFKNPSDVYAFAYRQKRDGKTIGFAPTMGYLHEGHASLFKKAAANSDVVIASSFVNPTQFGEREDFIHYPKNPVRDAMLAESCGVHALFLPNTEAIYPNGEEITVKVNARTDVLCGKSRPGHFDGVATVLSKLFTIVQPDHVYFGMKDAQQVAIVQALIQSFHFPIKLIACPIIREPDGLAKSSRNVRLRPDERREAPFIYQGLQHGHCCIKKGERNFDRIIATVSNYYHSHLKLGQIDYVDALNYPELKRMHPEMHGKIIIAVAVCYDQARLIDNITIEC
ncbi:pantoate--beta-alanine ligase [Sporolactobacillus sp. CPB3-1]|uniref:Pantothenate synthetase n=1 Tax=Sporolactobacillus mangiferae TaxID=2940498 RepID=A0ABT0MCL3_9BACL|nr:pantoate--beta-alanine ligase [Sporolactobacillus mangiferae]MCL1632610.1 pantoate--beta-alanine ligase [Sporolactobacillus mangiferae]